MNPTPLRVFAVYEALKMGMSIDEIHTLTRIDNWFLEKIQRILTKELKIKEEGLTESNLKSAKKEGFSDSQISKICEENFPGKYPDEMDIRAKRKEWGIIPVTKKIDTLAGEFPAKTNYMYMTYHGTKNDG